MVELLGRPVADSTLGSDVSALTTMVLRLPLSASLDGAPEYLACTYLIFCALQRGGQGLAQRAYAINTATY